MTDKLRVLIYKGSSHYIAQGLELDICAQGISVEAAFSNLKRMVDLEKIAAEVQGKTIEHIGPAPEIFFNMYDRPVLTKIQITY